MSARRNYRLQRQGDLLWLRAAVGSSAYNSLVVRLLVDTGSSYTVLPAQVLERLGCNCHEPLRTTAIVTAGGVIAVPIVAVPWFNCLGVRREDFPVVALDLPMAASDEQIISLWLSLQSLKGECETEAVFVTSTGNRLDRHKLHRIIKAAAERAGVNPNVSAHWLRHAHACHSLENGCDIDVLMRSLGHSSLTKMKTKYHR